MDRAVDSKHEETRLGELQGTLVRSGLVVAVIGIVASLGLSLGTGAGMRRLLFSYLTSWVFFLSLAVGGIFFVIMQRLTRSSWGVAVRRIAEAVATNVLLMAVLMLPLLLGLRQVWHWAAPGAMEHDALLQHKQPYLNVPFFLIRVAVYFLVWSLIAVVYWRNSVQQDTSGDPEITLKLERRSAPLILALALATSFGGLDFLMTLDPHWFSTIFGVYFFAGCFLSIHALLAVLVFWLQSRGRLTRSVNTEHYHDIGKFMFGFTVFWAYIAFSQYMLIWYGNLPEETGWYLRRFSGSWAWVSWFLLFGNFVFPFLALISRRPKRRPRLLALLGLYILAVHFIDIYWLVMPEFDHATHAVPLHLLDLTCLMAVGGLFVTALGWRLGLASLIPERDPRLPESLGYENL